MARPEKSSRPILCAHRFIFRDSDAAILACGSLDRNRTDAHNAFIMMTDGMSCTLDLFSPDAGGDDRAPASAEALLQAATETCSRRAEIHFQRRFERPGLTPLRRRHRRWACARRTPPQRRAARGPVLRPPPPPATRLRASRGT